MTQRIDLTLTADPMLPFVRDLYALIDTHRARLSASGASETMARSAHLIDLTSGDRAIVVPIYRVDPPQRERPPELPVAHSHACTDCGSVNMIQTGTCYTCADCGGAGGCG